jgi:LuxR family transcriptional regulator, activator of conjugal transfer of Ti plasmids
MHHHILFDRLNQLLACQNIDSLCKTFERIMCHYGFDRYALAFDKEKKDDGMPVVLATYEKEWVDYYFGNGYEKIDPVMLTTKSQQHPFLWNDVWQGLELTKKQTNFFYEAKEYGISSGFSIPIGLYGRENGMISLVSSVCDTEEISQITSEKFLELVVLTNYFQQIADKIVQVEGYNSGTKVTSNLTNREIECLGWAAKGKTNYEIGRILGISEHTVRSHIQSVCRKLAVTSKIQACIKAIMSGVVKLDQ